MAKKQNKTKKVVFQTGFEFSFKRLVNNSCITSTSYINVVALPRHWHKHLHIFLVLHGKVIEVRVLKWFLIFLNINLAKYSTLNNLNPWSKETYFPKTKSISGKRCGKNLQHKKHEQNKIAVNLYTFFLPSENNQSPTNTTNTWAIILCSGFWVDIH